MIDRQLTLEMRAATAGLPLYMGGPGVDYRGAAQAYAANVTLLHDPNRTQTAVGSGYVPSPEAEVLIVQRQSGEGVLGSWSGVSGYVDTMYDPTGAVAAEEFDPLLHTVRTELSEECGLLQDYTATIDVHLGKRFVVERPGCTLHVLPLLGILPPGNKPAIAILRTELSDYCWCRLADVAIQPALSPGYIQQTLPHALGAIGCALPG